MSLVGGAQNDNIFVNRNCGYCGQTLLKINQDAFMIHVNDCEKKAAERIGNDRNKPGSNPAR